MKFFVPLLLSVLALSACTSSGGIGSLFSDQTGATSQTATVQPKPVQSPPKKSQPARKTSVKKARKKTVQLSCAEINEAMAYSYVAARMLKEGDQKESSEHQQKFERLKAEHQKNCSG